MEIVEKITKKLDEHTKLAGEKYDAVARRQQEIDSRLASLEGVLTQGRRNVSLPGVEDERDKFSFGRMIRAAVTGDWSGAGFEHEVVEQTRKRALSEGTDTAGGYLVPTQVASEVIELLRPNLVLDRMGVTIHTDVHGSPYELPRIEGGAQVFWVGENDPLTESEENFTSISMTPKEVGALVKMSNRFVRLASTDAEDMVRADIARALALEIDRVALRGSGTGFQPGGISNTAGILEVSIGTDGGVFDFSTANEMVKELAANDSLRGRLGFVMHPLVAFRLTEERVAQYSGDTSGARVVLPMTERNLRDTLGWDFASTTQIPTNLTKGTGTALSEVYFGNWEELVIALWGGMEFFVTQQAGDAFARRQTWVRVIQEVDMALRHEKSFCIVRDAETQ